jgi:hypothetical protein
VAVCTNVSVSTFLCKDSRRVSTSEKSAFLDKETSVVYLRDSSSRLRVSTKESKSFSKVACLVSKSNLCDCTARMYISISVLSILEAISLRTCRSSYLSTLFSKLLDMLSKAIASALPSIRLMSLSRSLASALVSKS